MKTLVLIFLLPVYIYAQPTQSSEDIPNHSFSNQTVSKEAIIQDSSISDFPILKEDFVVNSFEGISGATQRLPQIAIDSSCNYGVVWADSRNGGWDIYVQFYNALDGKIGENILVNASASGYLCSISASPKGEFLITWLASNYLSIYAQRFSSPAKKYRENFVLNSLQLSYIDCPSTAINNDGSFVALWFNSTDNGNEPYVRFFNELNMPAFTEYSLVENDNYAMNIELNKSIAIDGQGNYLISWYSFHDRDFKIIMQLLNSEGYKNGNNIVASELYNEKPKSHPGVSCTDDGHFMISWSVYKPVSDTSLLVARIFNVNSKSFVGQEIECFRFPDYIPGPEVTTDRENNFYIQANPYYYNFFFIEINKMGILLGEHGDIRPQTDPFVPYLFKASDVYNDHYQLVYELRYKNNNNRDIAIERCSLNSNPNGNYSLVNDDTLSSMQENPICHINSQGYSIILWSDNRQGKQDLYAQFLDPVFNPKGANVKINDNPLARPESYAISSLSDGTFVICFFGPGNTPYDSNVYLQLIKITGEKIGKNVLVNETDNYYSSAITLNTNYNDDIMVCWYSIFGASFKKFNKNLLSLSATIEVNLEDYNILRMSPSVSINKQLNILYSWVNKNNQTYVVEKRLTSILLNEYGEILADTFFVACDYEPSSSFNALDNDNNILVGSKNHQEITITRRYLNEFIINDKIISYIFLPVKVEYFNNRIISLVYGNNDTVKTVFFNDNKRVMEARNIYCGLTPDSYYGPLLYYDLEFSNDKLLFVYHSPKHGQTGTDIWANVRQLTGIGFGLQWFYPPVNDDVLYYNFPNPFNATTKIAYEILSYHHVKLAVYDILGREVKVLVNQPQEKGLYEVEFNSAGLASGIYFYRLDAFRTSVKKMIVLK